jgi:flagellar hook-associated protein 2
LHTDDTNPIKVSLSPDTEVLVEKITSFVDKYNEIIETINGKLSEKKDYDYKPLTEDEKEAMTEDEIELWEERAKRGLLGSSSELQNISTRMRTLIYEPIEGLDITLRDIGIETSSNYKENGKLIINQDKLKESINNNYSRVVDLFTKSSDIDYKDGENRAQRTSESGIAYRIYDVLQDNIRTTRNDAGKKGVLLEKAGITGDITEFKNTMNDEIKQYDNRIDDLIEYLNDRENYYYRMFAQMEKAMTEMQTQASWLQGNMG